MAKRLTAKTVLLFTFFICYSFLYNVQTYSSESAVAQIPNPQTGEYDGIMITSEASFKLFTPEPSGARADKGYYLHWRDWDSDSSSINLYCENQATGAGGLINQEPIDASLTGFLGDTYFWQTTELAEGKYKIWADLIDENGQLVSTSIAPGALEIEHAEPVPDQQIFVYSFVHLKNHFIMESERDGISKILDALEKTGYNKFEFTFNWPIAWYLEHGMVDDRPGHDGEYLFEPDPGLIERLIDFADSGGSIGAYEPLAGWHYRNMWAEFPYLLEDWEILGRKAIKYEMFFQDQITGNLDPNSRGAKVYLDSLFGRPTIELGGNSPLVCFHITRLLGNRVLAQWSPHVVSDHRHRIIDGRDYYDGNSLFWYLGQLTFDYYSKDMEQGTPLHPFRRQVPMLGDTMFYDGDNVPIDNQEFQSFQESVDETLRGIRKNRLPYDMFYIFEHGISMQNMFDDYAKQTAKQLQSEMHWLDGWTLSRMQHMNCAPEVRLPYNNWDYNFRESYKASDEHIASSSEIMQNGFEYVKYLADNDPNIHLVTGEDLYDMVKPIVDQPVSADTLKQIAEYTIANLYRTDGETYVRLPAYIRLPNDSAQQKVDKVVYFNLAESFKMLADALIYYSKNGVLPGRVTTKYVLGPTRLESDRETFSESVSFEISDIIQAAKSIDFADPLGDLDMWKPLAIVPQESYQTPSYVDIAGSKSDQQESVAVNAAEFMILLAKTYLNLCSKADAPISAEPARPLTEWAYKVQMLDGGYNPDSANVYEGSVKVYFNHIQLWTFKPAEMEK